MDMLTRKKKNSNNETTIMRSEICKELKEEMPRKAYQIERETNEIIVQNKVNWYEKSEPNGVPI
jgi:hypothetical protein